MLIVKTIRDLRDHLGRIESSGPLGFVPTMGALHEGHVSLIRACKQQNPVCVASIYVNPTQFNNPDDFKKYPVTLETDIDKLEAAGTDVLFLPSTDEIYPRGVNEIHYDLGYLDTILEGSHRPGHFQGVAQIVDKLLQAVKPSDLYLGRKDLQQCMIIKHLFENSGSEPGNKPNNPLTIHICPIIREADGLAMSSRNMRLNVKQRKQAGTVYQVLLFIKKEIQKGNLLDLRDRASHLLEDAGFRIDYVEIVDADTLHPVTIWDGSQKLVALIAAFIDDIRLIDNMELN